MLSSLRARVLAAFIIPLAMSVVGEIWLQRTTRQMERTITDLETTQTLRIALDEIEDALAALEQIFLVRAGYAPGPAPSTADYALARYRAAMLRIAATPGADRVGAVKRLTDPILDRLAARGLAAFSAAQAVEAAGATARAAQNAHAVSAATAEAQAQLREGLDQLLRRNELAPDVGIAVALALVVAGLLGLGTITRPLRAAESAARAVAEGDFAIRIAETGPEELQLLGGAMNRMAEAIATRDQKLKGALEEVARHRDLLHSLVDATNVGLLLYDASGRLVTANRPFAEIFGFTVAGLLEAEPAAFKAEVKARCDDPDACGAALERHFAHVNEAHQDEIVFVRPRRRVFRRYSCPVFDGAAQAGRVFTLTDVTAEADLNRMKSEFVSTASHELRTPLTSVHGALQLALAGAGSHIAAEDRELLEISLLSTERLVRLVNDLLDLSKIGAGRMPMTLTTIPLPELFAEAADAIRGFAATRQMTVDVECAADMPAIEADRDQLNRVLANLLGNAVKYSPEGGRITLSAAAADEAVEIAVADEGAPIPPEQVDRLFMPFSRVGAQERQTTGGTGLGLALSRAIVTQHEGRIWVEQDQRRGKRFVFRLPVVHQAAVADRQAA